MLHSEIEIKSSTAVPLGTAVFVLTEGGGTQKGTQYEFQSRHDKQRHTVKPALEMATGGRVLADADSNAKPETSGAPR
jgi:hypothetical protein